MPCYPAFALLIGSAIAGGGIWIRRGTKILTGAAALAAVAVFAIWWNVRNLPAPGDISQALHQGAPGTYTLSLGHMGDLTMASFAYLRLPLLVAGAAFLVGVIGTAVYRKSQWAYFSAAGMMILFFHAARLALIVFDPYLSSRPLADALLRCPAGQLVIDHHYYTYSSVFFYTDRTAFLRNGRIDNLIYGSYAPGAPDVFIDDRQWKQLWLRPSRCYLVISQEAAAKLPQLVGEDHLTTILQSGGKELLTNSPLPLSGAH